MRQHEQTHVDVLPVLTETLLECTHGGVLNLYTGFSACHTTPHRTPQHNTKHAREKRREAKRWEMREGGEEKVKGKRRQDEKRRKKMKRERRWREIKMKREKIEMREERVIMRRDRELKNVWKIQVRQTNYLTMILKKSPSDELFVKKFRILLVFSIIYLIRIRIFGPRELIQNEFLGAQ